MSACVVVHMNVKDPEKFQAYASEARKTVAANGGERLFLGKVADVFAGEHGYKGAVILKFPDAAAARAWYTSPENQALIPNREEAADVVIVCCEEA